MQNNKLNNNHRRFCEAYAVSRDAEAAAKEAGFTARYGHTLLKRQDITELVREIKEDIGEGLKYGGLDVLRMYERIAFADARDYAEWGSRPVTQADGSPPATQAGSRKPTKTPEGCAGYENYLLLKDCAEVDGQIIDEMSSTSKSVKIKLCDRMKALEKLEKYHDIMGEDWKRVLAEKRLDASMSGKGSCVVNVITNMP